MDYLPSSVCNGKEADVWHFHNTVMFVTLLLSTKVNIVSPPPVTMRLYCKTGVKLKSSAQDIHCPFPSVGTDTEFIHPLTQWAEQSFNELL